MLRTHAGTVELSEFIPVFRTLRETAILRLSSSKPVEPLQLENWLQQRIAARTGQDDTTR